MIKVSVIIPYYNDKAFIGRAINSIFSQIIQDFEIILINDGSDKENTIALNEYTNKIDRIIHQSNMGQGAARNTGINEAVGEYILTLDSDDYFEPDFLVKAIEKFENDPTISLITCKCNVISNGKIVDRYEPNGGILQDFLVQNCAWGSSLYRKSDWKTIGGYDESRDIWGYEDWEFYIRLMALGGRCNVLNEILFNYQLSPFSTSRRIKKNQTEKVLYIIKKHESLYTRNYDCLLALIKLRLGDKTNQIEKLLSGRQIKLGKGIEKILMFTGLLFLYRRFMKLWA